MAEYFKSLPNDAKSIAGTLNWCCPNGDIYTQITKTVPNRFHKNLRFKTAHYGEFYKLTQQKISGYLYCTLKYDNGDGTYYKKERRAHIVIAETFLENPDQLPIVGHKNNIKTDNRVDNLYWTTWSENTKKAVCDRLLVNAIGYDDSQSKPVIMYETRTNKVLGKFGSIREAVRQTGLPMTTISRQAKYKRPVRKSYYFRYDDEYLK